MTPNEITTLIASNLERQLDLPFKKQLYERVKYWRGILVKASLEKRPTERKFFTQSLYVQLSRRNILSGGLKEYWSVSDTIPAPMRISNTLFDYVGSIDGRVPYGNAVDGTLHYLQQGKYSKNVPLYKWEDTKIWTPEDNAMLKVVGIFDDPEEVNRFNCASSGQGCDSWNEEIPMTTDIAQRAVQYILQVDYQRVLPDQPKEVNVAKS